MSDRAFPRGLDPQWIAAGVMTLVAIVLVLFAPPAMGQATTTTTSDPAATTTSIAIPTTTVPAAPPTTAARPPYVGPPVPAGSGAGRRVVYSNHAQRVWLIEGDETVTKSYLVSGRRGLPRLGTYHVFAKARYTATPSGAVRMEYMIRFARGRDLSIGFHTIPVRLNGRPIQTLAQLGTPRSHGCVRESPSDAAYLWDWASMGTTVVAVH